MKKKKNLWSSLILLTLIAVTFWCIFRNNDVGKIFAAIAGVRRSFLLLGLALMFVFVASEGLGIKALLKSLNYKSSYRQCLKYSFLGFYYTSVLPSSGGPPMQVYYMNRDGVEVGDASLCIMVIAIAYQLGMLLICLSALVLRFGFINRSLGIVKYFSLLGALVDAALLFLYTAVAFRSGLVEKILLAVINFLAKLKIIRKPAEAAARVENQLSRFRKAAQYVRRNPKVLAVTLLMIVIQLLSRLSVAYMVYLAFGLRGYGYLDILSLQAFLALGVEYLPIPGSVGIAEAGFYRVNALIFGSGLLMPATLLTRGISYYAFLLISGSVAVFAHLRPTLRHPGKLGPVKEKNVCLRENYECGKDTGCGR